MRWRWRRDTGVRSLYLSIYFTVVAVLLVFALIAAVLFRRHAAAEEGRIEAAVLDRTRAMSALIEKSLPAAGAPEDEQRDALLDWSHQLKLPLALDDAGGRRIAESPVYRRIVDERGRPESEVALASRLPDGRVLWTLKIKLKGDKGGRHGPGHGHGPPGPGGPGGSGGPDQDGRPPGGRPFDLGPPLGGPGPLDRLGLGGPGLLDEATGVLLLLGALFVAVTAGAYPVVRRLTRRLEILQRGVELFGSGRLSHRVDARGRDEVAAVAASFNQAAQRIEDLVRSNRSLLANASHELRSPLARLKMAVSMFDHADPAQHEELRREIDRDIRELDELVEEVLLASRLDARSDMQPELVDLLGLLVEEAARVGAEAGGEEVQVLGEERLLRRALRNLLENARRYGGDEVSADVGTLPDGRIEISIRDRGPGVPAEFRERIFEPFYRLPGHAERAGGVGLGLSLVRQIAERHGGRVRCEGREGGGTCFVITLPSPMLGDDAPALGRHSG
ncbi:sensor histidine kinase [Sphaerotilus uruguayifluvii]|uniref:histidine kinase n=1 Tax=Sphaerotilus uruguayifluvii TaxID=2735897 RepID=A0ABX2G9K5_9BURK|nr:HAMP domain-containing sensor histidine kinase [Leptothrix sp. C29]NRT57982.1 signal transduction histidine kinase [Leptothrix sp. C29]